MGSSSHWVLGNFPGFPGGLNEEAKGGQLGVLSEQRDASTSFALKSAMRVPAHKAGVRMDCGRRYRTAISRNARHIDKDYHVGGVVIYCVIFQGARSER